MSDRSVQGEFKKELGLFEGVSILGGIMIGSGIFYLGSYVLMRTNMTMGLAVLCWVLGGLVSMLGGLCYAELGASDPVAGGATIYLKKAYSPMLSFISGFNGFLVSGPGSIAGLAIALPTALKGSLGLSEMAIKAVAIALIITLTYVNMRGVKFGAVIQNLSMVGKMIPILIILVLGLAMGKEQPDMNIIPQGLENGGLGSIISMTAFAVMATLWAYEGWVNLNTVAEEMKNPEKNLPMSIIIAIAGITVTYSLFNYAIFKVVPFSQIQSQIEAGDFYLGTTAANILLGSWGSRLVIITMVIAMFGSLNGCILAFPRSPYAMAKEGIFFEGLGYLHPKYGVPTNSLIAQGIISILLVIFRSLDQLTSLVVFSGMIFKVLVVLAVIVYRKKFPAMDRPYKVFLYPFTVILTAALLLGLVINTLIEDPVTSMLSIVSVVLGGALFKYFEKKNIVKGSN